MPVNIKTILGQMSISAPKSDRIESKWNRSV